MLVLILLFTSLVSCGNCSNKMYDKYTNYNEHRIGYGRLFLFSAALLLLKRIPPVFLFRKGIPTLETWKEVSFLAWFGPVGAAALFYSLLIYIETGLSK